MVTIHSLKPNVNRAEAIEKLRGGIAGLVRWVQSGALRSVADVHVPYRLYQVEISNAASRQTSWFALDAVSGSLDLYQFDRMPDEAELVQVETRNRPEPVLEDGQALRLLEDKLRRVIFHTGFFRIRGLRIRAELVSLDLHIPYWIGFFGSGESVRLRVIDAVRRRFEGAKARAFFESWLRG